MSMRSSENFLVCSKKKGYRYVAVVQSLTNGTQKTIEVYGYGTIRLIYN